MVMIENDENLIFSNPKIEQFFWVSFWGLWALFLLVKVPLSLISGSLFEILSPFSIWEQCK